MRAYSHLFVRTGMIALAAIACSGTAFGHASPPPVVPELDPSALMGAVALLVGGLMILVDKRRAR